MYRRSICLMILLGVLGLTTNASAGLVGHWWLNDGSGTIAADSSGNGNDGTLIGEPQWAEQGIAFDGVDDWIDMGNPDQLPDGAAPRSICAWVMTQSLAGGWRAAVAYGSPAGSQSNGFAQNTATLSGFGYGNDLQVLNFFEIGVWYHLCLTYDGTTAVLYSNGEELMSEAKSWDLVRGFARIGRQVNTAAEFWSGGIYDVRIYDHVLAPDEILEAMRGKPELSASPIPDDKAIDVPRDVVLAWTPGKFADTHDVYFGTSQDDVNDASKADSLGVLVSQEQDANAFDPDGVLEFGQTYYWRIDEVNAAPDKTVFKGGLWSFTVEPLAYPVENITATSNGASDPGISATNLVNGSGLNADDQHSVSSADMWVASPGDEPLQIQFELDRAYKLHQMLVWNYNVEFELLLGFGIKEVTVEYSENGTDWAVLGDAELARATAQADYTANTAVDLQGVTARFVRLTVNSGYSILPTPQYGLSEVRFMHIPIFAREPQPADGATTEDANVVLNWRAGREAAEHQVYLGTSVGQTAQWKIDFQGGANHNDTYGQTDPVNMAEDGVTWNIFEVPALDAEYPGPVSIAEGPTSLDLLDAQGNAAGVVFTDLNDAWAWSGSADQQSQPMAGDYLLILGSFGVDCNPSSWEITGLSPASDYELTFHHAANDAADRGCNFTANGIAAQVTGAADTATITVTTNNAGTISGDVNSDGFGEGNWAGLVIAGAPAVELALVDTVDDTTFSAIDLIYGQTYFWQIVEVNEVEVPSTHTGPLWRFNTPDYAVVDDFESYTDDIDAGEAIFLTWIDGYEAPANGSMVGHIEAPFAETIIVHGGSQSMPIFYDNTGTSISEAELALAGQDWTAGNVQTLSLYISGAAGNSGQLYLKINNTKVLYDGDSSDITGAMWRPWNIDLSAVGGNMSNVTLLTIGIEGAGAQGVVYIDDIRLYPKALEYLTPTEPDTAGLVAHYALDGNVADSSGNGYDGVENDDPSYGDGVDGQAIRLDGIGDFVDFGEPAGWPEGTEPRSLCGWGMTSSVATGWRWMLAYGSGATSQAMFIGMNGTGLYGGGYGDDLSAAELWTINEWHHVGLTYDGAIARLYADGVEVASAVKNWNLNPSRAHIGRQVNDAAEFWDGMVDDVRLYGEALSAEEIAWIAGKRAPMHKPL